MLLIEYHYPASISTMLDHPVMSHIVEHQTPIKYAYQYGVVKYFGSMTLVRVGLDTAFHSVPLHLPQQGRITNGQTNYLYREMGT